MLQDQAHLFEAYFADRSNIKIRNKIIKANLNLVKSRAAKWARENPRYREDFIQVGTIAMIQSLERFNPVGCKFSTYAVYAIDTAIKRFLHDYGYSPIRRPSRHYDIIHTESAVIAEYRSRYGRKPSKNELFRELSKRNKNFTAAQYYLAKESQSVTRMYSLDYQSEDDDIPLADYISLRDYIPEEGHDDRVDAILKGINQLPPPQQKTLLLWSKGYTDDQIASAQKIGKNTAKTYRFKGLDQLRKILNAG